MEQTHNDLYGAIKLAEHPLFSCLPQDNFCLLGNYETAHDLGRWIEAALLMEHCVGTQIPASTEKILRLHLRSMMCNPYALLLNDAETLGKGCLNYHNLREALLSLTALVKFRNSRWAEERAEQLLHTIQRRFLQKTLTDEEICHVTGLPISPDPFVTRPATDPYGEEDYTTSTGRAIEGMYWFYRVTGSSYALEVMEQTVAFHREHTLRADGSPPEWMLCQEHVGHNHSYLGTLRGLMLYAMHFHDDALAQAIYHTYRNSIPLYSCTASGFAPHDLAQRRFSDSLGDPVADPASCADTAYIAYLLAVYGYPELFDDAERLIRGRLLFTQIQDGPDIGSWGIYAGYFGKGRTIDVFALIASTLSVIYKDSIVEKDDGLWIYLHFSHNHPSAALTVQSDTHRHLTLLPQKQQAVHIRIPRWCDSQALQITADGTPVPYTLQGTFAVIPAEAVVPGKEITLTFPLPLYETVETTWDSNISYRIFWKGDDITSFVEIPNQ